MNINERVLKETDYLIDTNKTIREIAKKFQVSKSTVHKDLSDRLKKINRERYLEVKKILDYHLKIRHIRGGIATKQKYSRRW